MSAGRPTRAELPADTRPAALLVSGLRRGAVLVFLPLFVAGQALAWLTYAASGWYRPWSWFKIGLAETLASVRVPFTAGGSAASAAVLQLALGALTILVLVLAFRPAASRRAASSRERALRRSRARRWASGSRSRCSSRPCRSRSGFRSSGSIGWSRCSGGRSCCRSSSGRGRAPRVAPPPRARRSSMKPAGGAAWPPAPSAARSRCGGGSCWRSSAFCCLPRSHRGRPAPTPGSLPGAGGSGAAAVILHATLLPNQSAMILATSMGGTTTLSLAGEPAVTLTRHGGRRDRGPGLVPARPTSGPREPGRRFRRGSPSSG